MQEIVQFCIDNWQWLLTAILSIFVLIIQLLKKKPVVRSLYGYCEFIVSQWMTREINKAEVTGLHGEAKKQYVIDRCMNFLKQLITLDEKATESAIDYFSKSIEDILSTPRKKS